MASVDVALDAKRQEHGGRLLRTALSLSLVTGKSFRLGNLRDLTADLATTIGVCAAISEAAAAGGEIGSTEVTFRPGPVRPGNYRFDLGAVPAAPVFQTLLWPLAFQKQPSTLALVGVTHAANTPAFEYLSLCWLPLARRLGAGVTLLMPRAGFPPGRGGDLRAVVRGGAALRGLRWRNPAVFDRFTGFSVQAGLGEEAANKQAAGARTILEAARIFCPMSTAELASRDSGAAITLVAGSPTGVLCVSSHWQPGQPHEAVGREAAETLLQRMQTRAPLHATLAEELLVPLAMAQEPSLLLMGGPTGELEATALVVEAFLRTRISIAPEALGRVLMQVEPG